MCWFINIPKSELFKCTIETPQFHGSQDDYHMHRQSGWYNKATNQFVPFDFSSGNHVVHFSGIGNLKKFLISIDK